MMSGLQDFICIVSEVIPHLSIFQMQARLRKPAEQTIETEPFLDSGPNMADTIVNGNKVSDVNSTKVTSNNNDVSKSPSIHSHDSCTKLTVDKEDTALTCCGGASKIAILLKLVACFLCGIVFGVMFVKSRGEYEC